MPRSRQISAITTPIGWRRTAWAICSGVGSAASRSSAAACRGAARLARGLRAGGARGRGFRVRAVGALEQPCLERVGALQATGDGGQDQRDIGGAEAEFDGGEVGGALLQRCGQLPAVVDQLADQAEQAADRAGRVRAGRNGRGLGDGGGGRGGHGRNNSTGGDGCQGKYSD